MQLTGNTGLVQRAYQSVGTGDIQTLLNLLTEDVIWELPEMPNVPFSGTWRGRKEVAKFFSIMADVQDVVEFEPDQFVAQGDQVVALGHFTMRIKATGKLAKSKFAHVWTFKNGQVTEMREYVDSLAVSQAHQPMSQTASIGRN
jgi:ketosteroid isomerase-like protein